MKNFIFIILSLLYLSSFAQDTILKNKVFSINFGGYDYYFQNNSNQTNLDFINYIYTDPKIIDYIVFSLDFKFDYLSKMSADINLIMMDDLVPDNFDISTHYYLKPWFSVGVGSALDKIYINGFEQYQKQLLPSYFLLNDNQVQFRTYDLGFYFSPIFRPINKDKFKISLKIDMGLSSFLNNEIIFYHKRKYFNDIVNYRYKTRLAFQPYISPVLELQFQILDLDPVYVGGILKTAYRYSNRSINYRLTVTEWVNDNDYTNIIKPFKHSYSILRFSAGVYFRF